MQVSTLTFLITVISTGAGIVAAMFGFGVFFIRRLDNQTRELRAEIQGLRTEIEGVRTDFGTRLDNQTRELRAESKRSALTSARGWTTRLVTCGPRRIKRYRN